MSLYATDVRQRGTLKCLMVAFEGKEEKNNAKSHFHNKGSCLLEKYW